jgi:sulfatase modifying factor 1
VKIPSGILLKVLFAAALISYATACNTNIRKTNKPEGMILINGGTFQMGSDDGMPFEAPVHAVEIEPFYIDEHEVTVAEFAKFVDQTHYVTEAEKFGWSAVFDLGAGEWRRVDGATWRHPEGGDSVSYRSEPACQISWNDANAFARWAGKRLPTEAEFEFAARGGLEGKEYAWGDELKPRGKFLANWWQGTFPVKNTAEDGFIGRAPIKSFSANGYGIYEMTGNVWEWCSDWFDEDYYSRSSRHDPHGPEIGDERVIRGGSFLCAENYCSNYRVAGRSHSTPDSAMNNLGFRCARDAK